MPAKKKNLRKVVIVAATVAVLALCLGCAQTTEQSNEATNPTNSEEPIVEVKSLEEWVEEYPLQGGTYMQSTMSGTYDAFYEACVMAFGAEDAPVACATCHARYDFNELYAKEGEDCLPKNTSDYDLEWSNCTNCHVGDPGDGIVEGGNMYGEMASASASVLFPDEDLVCGQCHAMFPGAAYMEDANKGIDQYKYGYDPDSMLKAMQEYYADNEVTSTIIPAGMVGVPYLDPNINTVLYLTDACTAVEVFQESNHQSMGLTCTDCHMPQSTAEDGTTYRNHNMTSSPLENPDALAKCLTCHESQGIKNADAMAEFVKGKMNDLISIEKETKANMDNLYSLLTEAVANDSTDEAILSAAQASYNLANVYYLYQIASLTPETGQMAAMNFDYCVELLERANNVTLDAIATLA